MALLDALPDDFRDLLVALADAKAEFVLIGGWALAVRGRGRATEDLDVLVRPTAANAERVFRALVRFGAPAHAHGVSPSLFAAAEYGYRLASVRTSSRSSRPSPASTSTERGVAHAPRAWTVAIKVIGRAALLANKRAAPRGSSWTPPGARDHGGEQATRRWVGQARAPRGAPEPWARGDLRAGKRCGSGGVRLEHATMHAIAYLVSPRSGTGSHAEELVGLDLDWPNGSARTVSPGPTASTVT